MSELRFQISQLRKQFPREYITWKQIKQRCHNPKHDRYNYYGGRGIAVCDEWRGSFKAFIEHIGPKPSPAHTIERIDNDGGYGPGNVRWVTVKEQCRNRRTSHLVEHNGRMISLAELAEIHGLSQQTITSRIHYGWPDDRLAEPVRGKLPEGFGEAQEAQANV
jgi:hypothetical protein